MRAKLLRGFNPWVVIFVGTALFHTWRGSLQDIIIFGFSAALILTQVFGLYRIGFENQPQFPTWAIASVVLVSAVLLYVSPRHELVNFIVLLAFIPIGIALVMYRDKPVPEPREQVFTSRLLWGWWAALFALVELVAYVGSKLSGDLNLFPTISVILDPVLDQPLGRAVFVALWLMAGVYLFGIRRRK